jgi:UDPglucose 6-dehydrogenase
MRVAVVGTGHVGLVTCASLAAIGHDVVGADADPEKIDSLARGKSPFFEDGLDDLIAGGEAEGRLRFTVDVGDAVKDADIAFICVGTPPRADGEANLSAVERAAREVARHAAGRTLIVEKSTVPAGTSTRVKRAIQRERPDLAGELEVASNPEFLREGKAVQDSMHPDRILVGAEGEWAFEYLRELYKPLTDAGVPLIETNISTAELAKHACNAFLALKISYVNALARLCERSDADVRAVAEVMGSDPRIGRQFLDAGLGYGGYCFPKDLDAFRRLAMRIGYDFPMLTEVARINDEAVEAALDKIRDALWNLDDKKVALLGLAFKPGTDDIRFAPALELAERLIKEGARVVGCDPQASANAKSEIPALEVSPDPYAAAEDAHCVVMCTEWPEFQALDLARLKDVLAYPIVVDARNVWDPAAMEEAGFTYYSMGRPSPG